MEIKRNDEGAVASLTMTRPDDGHLHLRDGNVLPDTVFPTAKRFGRAIIMPNLKPPVRTVKDAEAYRHRILDALPKGMAFDPLMTLYLTDNTQPAEILAARQSGFVKAVKYYPAGATTNSDFGVTDVAKVIPVLEVMAEVGMPLLVHGEVTDPNVDIFDREAVFTERILGPLLFRIPMLKVVLEHVTTKEGMEFVRNHGSNVAATITPHHLLYNRNAIFQGGIRPHYYCLPVLKREEHRQALIEAATSGDPKFFAGTDSAPHEVRTKECSCGCAGIFNAYAAIELYAEAFEAAGKLETLEGFLSFHGPDFYGLPRNTDTITLRREPWIAPRQISFGAPGDWVIPLRAGEEVLWKLVD